jgi:hypothetical protein
VELSPLPCWEHLSPEQRRERIAALVGECDAEATERRTKTGRVPIGALAVQQRPPHSQPMTTKRSPAPLFHAATKRVRDELYRAYYGFLAAFREASEKWRSGDLGALALWASSRRHRVVSPVEELRARLPDVSAPPSAAGDLGQGRLRRTCAPKD